MVKKIWLVSGLVLLFSACSPSGMESIDRETARALTLYLYDSHQSPAALIRAAGQSDERVVLCGTPGIQSEMQLLTYLVPVLAEMDRLSLGFWFLNRVEQSILDDYFSGASGDYAARDILFLSDPARTGYEEYETFLVALRDFIRQSPGSLEWHISGAGTAGPEGDRPFLSYVDRNRLSDQAVFPEETVRILLHSPVLNSKGKMSLPFRGGLYELMIHDWPLYRYSGIPLEDSPFGLLPLFSDQSGEERLLRSEYDGLILLGIDDFIPFSPLEGFINEQNAPAALESFPDQLIRNKQKPASYLMNLKLRRRHRRSAAQLEDLTKILRKNYPAES